MALIEVVPENLTEALHLGDLYTYLRPGQTLRFHRPASSLPQLRSLKRAMAANQVAVGVTLTDSEHSSFPHDADLFAEETK